MKTVAGAVMVMLFAAAHAGAAAAGKVRAGNRAYADGDYATSLERFRQAEMAAPDDPVVQFNLGDALYKTEQFDEAATAFRRGAAGGDRSLRGNAFYNLGNALYRQQKFDEALDCYKKALDLDPGDEDAKYNIEFIARLKQQPKGDAKKHGRENKEKENGESGEKNRGTGQEQERDGTQPMTKEDAERILRFFNEQDRNAAEKRKMALPEIPRPEKDW